MVEAARGIDPAGDPGVAEQLNDAPDQVGRARRRVAQAIERIRKAEEVVDRLGTDRTADGGAVGFPMGGDAEDRLRTRQLRAQPGDELPGRDVLER